MMDGGLVYAFFLVFVRCSATLMSSPFFGAQNVPVKVRVFTTFGIAAALTTVLRPNIGQPPADMYAFAMAVGNEVLAGLIIGAFFSMVLHAATIAGTFLDTQVGLSLSQALNPITGVSVTVIAQFKYFLCLIVFLNVNAHHVLLQAFAKSYSWMPTVNAGTAEAVNVSLIDLLSQMSLLAIQMAAPVVAVSLVVDAALGIVNKAVPQMQVFMVGLPAKIIMGMVALSIALPALVTGVQNGVEMSTNSLQEVFAASKRANV